MADQRAVPPDSATSAAAALRQAGAAPLRIGDPRGIGPYASLGLLGTGGMGRVYLARPADGSPVLAAVKVIRPEYADDPGFRRRFEREASVHARLRSPHTPKLCGTGFQDEMLWMATQYVPGLDLADAVREDGALETAAVWRLVADLGRALADLAAAGIVHRDLKPSNVLLSPWGAYVIDFGLSKAADATALTGTGNRVGTPAYMSPEHLRTGRCDTASDVFSLAGTLVYAATGRAPFGDGTGVDVMHRVAFEEPFPELLAEISALDEALGSLLSDCLAKEPERRPTPQTLMDAAGHHTATSIWPEALGGKVLARQQAYELLRSLRSEQEADALPSPDEQQEAVAPTAPGAAGGAHMPARKKTLLAVTAGVTLCAVAGGFALMRQDDRATASSPGSSVTIGTGTAPGGTAFPPVPGATDRRTTTSGKSADGDASPPAVPTSSDTGRSTAPGVTDAEPGASATATATASPTDSPSEPAAPPWNSDCTYYSGYGRARRGNTGDRVLQVQCMLTKRGYGVGGSGVDGTFGPGTESAVRSFQSDKGLDADGIVGHETWTALRGTD